MAASMPPWRSGASQSLSTMAWRSPAASVLTAAESGGGPSLEKVLGAVEMLLIPLTGSTVSKLGSLRSSFDVPHSLIVPPRCQLFL